MAYDSTSVLESKVRPKQKQVELSLSLDTLTDKFDDSKAQQIALNVDGSDSRSNKDHDSLTFPSGMMDKQVLTSTKSVGDTSRYAVGILGDNELHLTPLAAIVSLRPDLKYLVRTFDSYLRMVN